LIASISSFAELTIGWRLPLQSAPPPFSAAWNPHHTGVEFMSTLVAAVVATLLYTPLVYFTVSSRRLLYRLMIGLLVAELGVSLQIPQTLVTTEASWIGLASVVGRALTLPAEAILRLVGVPLYLEGPGSSPPLFMQHVALSRGLLVLFTVASYVSVFTIIAYIRTSRTLGVMRWFKNP
jgi:hypothetical protein